MVLPSLRADTFITCGRTCMRIRKQRGVSWGGQDPGRERESAEEARELGVGSKLGRGKSPSGGRVWDRKRELQRG